MRNAFIQAAMAAAAADERVCLLMAEVGFSVVEPFQKAYPSRFYNTGIAEQDLVSIAAGMAMGGMRPIAYSMSAFLASRAFEQIKIDVCYQDLPVVLVSTGSGLSYGNMGATHHATEETALMRTLPNLAVLTPTCAEDVSSAFQYALAAEHPVYITMPKMQSPQLPAHEFALGKPVCCRDGGDGTVLAVGSSAAEALRAAEQLENGGIHLAVYGLHTLKPLMEQEICRIARGKPVFVVEEAQQCTGIGGEISRILLENGVSIKSFQSFAVPDCFAGPVYSYTEQLSQYGLSADSLAASILKVMKGMA